MVPEQTRDYYRQRAPEYEQIYYREAPERRREIDDEAAYLEDLAQGREVLDLTCGTGYWTRIAAEKAAMVVAADLWPEMIAEAGKKQYQTKPHFIRTDLDHPPFAPRSFELVLLGFWLSHQPKETFDDFFLLISSLVKPGGLIWTIDNNPPAEGPSNHSACVDKHGNNFKRRCLDNGDEFVILKNYFQRDELVDLVQPYFELTRLVYKPYYWSMLLRPKELT